MIDDLSSAEAGFLFAADRAGREASNRWEVDPITAPLLNRFLADNGGGIELGDEDRQILLKRRFRNWWQGFDQSEVGSAVVINQALAILDNPTAPGLEKWLARRQLLSNRPSLGDDLSPPFERRFDLRRFLEGLDRDSLPSRLIVLGAILVCSLNRGSLHRRLAANLRRLPSWISSDIRQKLEVDFSLDIDVERRVYEVYRTVAAQATGPDEEFALVGLYFVVAASVFRQYQMLSRLRRKVPESLRRRVGEFEMACLQSRTPELMESIAGSLYRVLESDREDCDE